MTINFPEKKEVSSFGELLDTIQADTAGWYLPTNCVPWYRGQANGDDPPRPGIFRRGHKEHDISLTFRKLAPSLGKTPDRNQVDEWLFLMQHVGVPTRLLDWTESLMAAVYFAVYQSPKSKPGIWVIHPLKLNETAVGQHIYLATTDDPLKQNFLQAFTDANPSDLPIAIQPVHIHPRMSAQKACFTIHGKVELSFENIFRNKPLALDGFFLKYRIKENAIPRIKKELKYAGVTHSSLFPDLDGLASEIRLSF